jgi:hypothetical protein
MKVIPVSIRNHFSRHPSEQLLRKHNSIIARSSNKSMTPKIIARILICDVHPNRTRHGTFVGFGHFFRHEVVLFQKLLRESRLALASADMEELLVLPTTA